MCDCAEELERRERAEAEELENALAALRAQSGAGFFSKLSGFFGGGGDGWLPFIGGAAVLLGLLGFFFKKFGSKLFNLKLSLGKKSGKPDPCDGKYEAPKPKPPPPKEFTPCQCNS